MKITEKEHKKLKKIIESKNNKDLSKKEKKNQLDTKLPDWFNMNPDKTATTEEDTKEMEEILAGLV